MVCRDTPVTQLDIDMLYVSILLIEYSLMVLSRYMACKHIQLSYVYDSELRHTSIHTVTIYNREILISISHTGSTLVNSSQLT